MAAEEGQVIGCHTPEQFKELIEKSKETKKLVVVDFTASWCPPCRFIAPIFVELAKKMPHVVFLKVDVDEVQPVAQEWDVEAMPTFIYLKDGVLVERIVGADKGAITAKLELHAPTPATAAI